MNVSEQLADAMLRIEPKNIRLLDYGAQRNYGLTTTDPIEQETLELQDAQWFKLDRQEYMKRKAVSEPVCPEGPRLSRDRVSLHDNGRTPSSCISAGRETSFPWHPC
jgi:hypothetical protein